MKTKTGPNYFDFNKIKAAIGHFLLGRIFTGLAGFLATILIARNLAINAYATYVIMLGLAIVVNQFSSLSLHAVAQRFIPEFITLELYRLQISTTKLIIAIRFCSSLLIATLLFIFLPQIATFFAITDWLPELKLWLIALYFSNLFRFISKILQTFLLQKTLKWITIAIALSRLSWLIFLIYGNGHFNLQNLIILEAVVHALGILVALTTISYHFTNLKQKDSQEPSRIPRTFVKRMIRYAFFDYLRNLVILFSGRAANRLIIGKLLPPLQIASFGFAQNLNGTVSRYLPSGLLRNLIQPILMGRYSQKNDLSALVIEAKILYKLNCFLLVPVIIWVSLLGNQLATILSNGKYPDSGLILACLLGLTLFQEHYEQILKPQANATEKNVLLFMVDFVPIFFLVPIFFYFDFLGIFGLIGLQYLGVISRDYLLIKIFQQNGLNYQASLAEYGKIFLAFAITTGFLQFLTTTNSSIGQLLLLGCASTLLFFTLSWFFGTLNQHEKGIINKVFPALPKLP